MRRNLPEQSYNPIENVLSVSHPVPVHLESRGDIQAYFDEIVRFWRESAAGRRAYYLVDWNGFSTNLRETDFYAVNVKRVTDECAITIVRYTENPLQRTAGRLVGLRLHLPSNIYETREQAQDVIRGLQAGAIRVGV